MQDIKQGLKLLFSKKAQFDNLQAGDAVNRAFDSLRVQDVDHLAAALIEAGETNYTGQIISQDRIFKFKLGKLVASVAV